MSRLAGRPAVRDAQGTRAGIISRAVADGVDLAMVMLLGLLVVVAVSVIKGLFTREVELVTLPQPARIALTIGLFVAYLGFGWGFGGRTVGKTLLGLRVVGDDGADISAGRGVLRAVLYLLVLPGFLWAAVSRRNASLQDLVVRTSVVHDWGFDTEPARDAAAAQRAGGATSS